ncbi:MAG: glycosyltransferase family 4 protein [Bacteroidales bacterium]|nr:glycosyltransferase family 4 protein [Bacteroidales bacterium]
MKLLYLIDTLYRSGGMERIIISKANALAQDYGYEVILLTNHQRGRPCFFPLSPKVRHVDIDVNYRLPFMMGRYVRKVSDFILREKPDICISTCGKELFQMDRLPGDCRKMAEFHFSHRTYLVKGQNAKLRRMEKAVRELDCFVVLTKEDALQWKPFSDNVRQIYNPSFFEPSEALADMDSKRLVAAGRFERQKNFQDLVTAWTIVHSIHPDWTLDIYGEGSAKPFIQGMVDASSLDGTLKLHPATDDLRGEMLRSSGMVMSSLYEGFPLVMIEAASVGLPFISYRCPCGPGEFIEDGLDGFTVPVGDVDALAARISEFIDSAALRRTMSAHIKQKSADFTPERIMPQWDALFKSLV